VTRGGGVHRAGFFGFGGAADDVERAGLVERRVAGRTHVCRLAPEPIEEAHRWLARYQHSWEERLDALEAELRRKEEAS